MAKDPTTGTKLAKPTVTSHGALPTHLPTLGDQLPTGGPPVKALENHGVFQGIQDVNDRVAQITSAHEKAMGYKPSPGMVFDILRATPEIQKAGISYDDLFSVPKTKREAASMFIARSATSYDNIATAPVIGGKLPTSAADRLAAKQKFAVEQYKRGPHGLDVGKSAAVATLPPDYAYTQGIGLAPGDLKTLHDFATKSGTLLGFGAHAAAQMIHATEDMPFGLYALAKASLFDARDVASYPLYYMTRAEQRLGVPGVKVIQKQGKPYPARLGKIGVAIGKSVAQDAMHPYDRMGYLILDVWAGYSAVANVGARAAVGAAAAREASGTAAKIGNFALEAAHRPVPEPYQFGFKAYTENIPMRNNAGARVVQRFILDRKQRALVERQSQGFDNTNGFLYDAMFSGEATLRRASQARVGIEYAITMAPAVEMARLARWDARAQSALEVIRSDPKLMRNVGQITKLQNAGIEKAMQVLFTDGPDPATAWRSMHEREINNIETMRSEVEAKHEAGQIGADAYARAEKWLSYSQASHENQLNALDLAERIMANPPKRFQPLLDRAKQINDEQQYLKQKFLGLDPDIAEQAIAKTRAILDGSELIDLGDGKLGIASRPVGGLLKQIEKKQKALKRAEGELSKARATMRVQPEDKTGDFQRALDRAQGKVDKHTRGLAKLEKSLSQIKEGSAPLEKQNPEARYLPSRRDVYQEKPSRFNFKRKGKYGHAPPENIDSLRYRNDGKAIVFGDFRYDVPDLLIEELMKTTKATFQHVFFRKLWDNAVPTKISPYHMPIRDVRNAPEQLKRDVLELEKSHISSQAAERFTEDRLREIKEWATKEREESEPHKHVRYVDERLMMDYVTDHEFWKGIDFKSIDRFNSAVFSPINEPMRIALIFATPAYALNALGQGVALISEYGMAGIKNLGRSMVASNVWDGEVARLLDTLGGETHTGSLVSERTAFTKASEAFMAGWQKVTDTHFRRAAVIGELRKRGVPIDSMSTQEFKEALQLKNEWAPKVIESAQVGRDAMFDFNRMSWFERATLRHMIFVYSFLRASSIWSLRFMIEHPNQSFVLAHAGEQRKQQIEALIGETPEWFLRRGYVPVAHNVVLDPIQVNLPGMFSSIAYPIESLFSDTPYASPSDLLGPAAQYGTSVLTGTDEQGRELPTGVGGRLGGAFLSMLQGTPIGYALARDEKAKTQAQKPLPPPPIHSGNLNPISAASARESAASRQSVFDLDGFWNNWGLVIGRSAVPRQVNAEAMAARHWRDLKETNPELAQQHQLDLVHQMVARQGKILGTKPTPEVLDAVDTVAKVSQYVDAQTSKFDGQINEKIKSIWMLESLHQQGKLGDKEFKQKVAEVKKANGPRSAKGLGIAALWQTAKAWQEWNDKANSVEWFARSSYTESIKNLNDSKLGNYTRSNSAPDESKYEYGRRYQEYRDKFLPLQAAADVAHGSKKALATAKLIEFENENSQPVTINGVTFPPPAAMRFIKQTPNEQQMHTVAIALGNWANLSNFDRSILRDSGPRVDQAWTALAELIDRDQSHLPPGKRLPAGAKDYYAAQIAKQVPSFKKDYDFSKQILAVRLSNYKPITQSRFPSEWGTLLRAAKQRYSQLLDAGYPKSAIADYWKKYDVGAISSWIADQPKGFQAEIGEYTKDHSDFIERLVSNG